jgi:hypothetical protein
MSAVITRRFLSGVWRSAASARNHAIAGSRQNTAVQKYLNSQLVASVFLTSGGGRFNDQKNFVGLCRSILH